MKPLHIETPFFESRALTIVAGRTVWLKLEAMQPPGSFKIRGIGLASQEYVRRGAKRLISSSGGNAGIAVPTLGAIYPCQWSSLFPRPPPIEPKH